MIKLTKDSDLRLEEYHERISSIGHILVDKEKVRRIYEYEKVRTDTNRSLARRTMSADSGGSYADMKRDSVIHYLMNVKGCPERYFKNKNTAGLSLNADTVITPLIADGYAQDFLGYYETWNSLKARCARVEGLMSTLEKSEDKTKEGRPLHHLSYNVEQQENLRYNYNNTDIISIPSEYNTTFASGDGYVLAWGDLKQSDFRIAYNLFIRDERNAAIMDSCDDKYEGIARVLAEFEGVEFSEEEFKKDRNLYKVNVLETIYNKQKGVTEKEDKFIQRFKKYLETCPRYQEFIRRIEARSVLGLQIPVTGYFGHTQAVDPNFRSRNGKRNANSVLSKCLNTPVQTGTSQIVILLVHEILDRFYALGYTEEDIHVYIVRHDEPIFRIKEGALKDAWILKEVGTAIVDNWTPIELEFDYGYNYKISDPQVVNYVNEVIESNKDKISVVEPDEWAEPYMPVPRTFICSVGYEHVYDKTVIALYDGQENNVGYYLVEKEDDEDSLGQLVLRLVSKSSKSLRDQGYTAVAIHHTAEESELFHEGVYYRLINKVHKDLSIAETFAHWAASKYNSRLLKEGVETGFEPNMYMLNTNAELLESAGKLDVLQG